MTAPTEGPGVRIRSMLTLSTGAALGAGVMYLFDPQHGDGRRREARREAGHQLRRGAVRAAVDARRRAEEMTVAAVAGYQQARAQDAEAVSGRPVGQTRSG